MAILKQEGFDLFTSLADLTARGFTFAEGTFSSATAKFGGNTLNLGASNNTVIEYPLGAHGGDNYVCVSFWRKFSAHTTSLAGNLIALGEVSNGNAVSGANVHAGIMFDIPSGALHLVYGGTTTNRQTMAAALSINTWQHFEFRVRMHATLGTVEFWVDGNKLVDVTGADTLDAGANAWVKLTGCTIATTNLVDDLVIQQGAAVQTQLGSHKIHTLLPNGNGTNTAWTGTVTDVDDPFGASDGDTTFANSTTLNAKQDYAVENLSESPTTIFSVALTSEMRKTDAGTKAATPYILSNAVEDTGVEHGFGEAYTVGVDVFELNPDGAVAWTETTVNAVLIGHEVTT